MCACDWMVCSCGRQFVTVFGLISGGSAKSVMTQTVAQENVIISTDDYARPVTHVTKKKAHKDLHIDGLYDDYFSSQHLAQY